MADVCQHIICMQCRHLLLLQNPMHVVKSTSVNVVIYALYTVYTMTNATVHCVA